MHRDFALALLAVALSSLAPPLCAGTITQFTDLNLWAAAVNHQYDTEHFDDEILVSGLSQSSGRAGIISGAFRDEVSLGEYETTWDLGRSTHGFGGSWDLSPGGIGQNLSFYITPTIGDEEVLHPDPALGLQNAFYGFVTDFEFRYVRVTGTSTGVSESPGGAQEAYSMDFLVFNGAANGGGDQGGEVPEPGTYVLAGAGLALLALFRRR